MTSPDASPPSTERASESSDTPHRVVDVHGTLALDRILTPREVELLSDVEDFARNQTSEWCTDLEQALETGLQNLARMALALESYPSLKDRHVLGRKERSVETLMRTLVEAGEHGLEWVLPAKAVLARTYGIAKVHFLTSLRYVVDACEGEEAARMRERLAQAVEEAVYTRLAEELYASFITARTTSRHVKELAAQHLIEMWEGRVWMVSDRFCPLLRSAWAARLRAPRVFGTLLGTTEIVQLLFEDCNEEFVGFFDRHGHDSEQRQAFEEFLFDLPFESLERVRQRMMEDGKTCVGPREVERYLGFGEGKLRPLVGGTKALYQSFRRRRVKAQYRASMGVPGPKSTAEAFLLAALLLDEERASASGA